MASIFRPRIIIGSLIGFIATAISIIAVFFPSLFNLETKKMDSFDIYINNCEGANELFSFLSSHEDAIVMLNIKYTEPEFFSNKILKNIDSDSKYEEKQNIYAPFEYEWEIGGDGKSASIFGDNRLFNLESDAKIGSYATSFSRESGGFGFWCKNDKSTPEKDLDFGYQIILPYTSDNNTLYYWGDDGDNSGSVTDRNMELRGTFLVSKLTESEKYKSEENNFMYPNWCEEKVFAYGADKCVAPHLFILQPLSKKEIELRKY